MTDVKNPFLLNVLPNFNVFHPVIGVGNEFLWNVNVNFNVFHLVVDVRNSFLLNVCANLLFLKEIDECLCDVAAFEMLFLNCFFSKFIECRC